MSYFLAHVYLLVVAWLIITPLAVLSGTSPLRRSLYPNDRTGNPPYTTVHRWAMMAVFVMSTAGIAIAYIQLSQGGKRSLHGVFGYSVYALICLQTLLGVARAYLVKSIGPRSRVQQFFTTRKQTISLMHRHLGVATWALAITTVLLGIVHIQAHYAHLLVVSLYSATWLAIAIHQVYVRSATPTTRIQEDSSAEPVVPIQEIDATQMKTSPMESNNKIAYTAMQST